MTRERHADGQAASKKFAGRVFAFFYLWIVDDCHRHVSRCPSAPDSRYTLLHSDPTDFEVVLV
jgi:hypothetical protein